MIDFWRKSDISKLPKKVGLLGFYIILRKSIVFYCDAKHSDTLQGFKSCLLLLVFASIQLSRFCQDSPDFWCAVPVSRIESIFPGLYISH